MRIGVELEIQAQLKPLRPIPRVVSTVFGTVEPAVIASALDGFCREQLGAAVVRSVFLAVSVGSVHGLELEDGRRVVVKAHRPGTSKARLVAAQEAQRQFAAAGVPAPLPLVAPSALRLGIGTAESLLEGRACADPHDPETRAEMAVKLARLARAGRSLVQALPELDASGIRSAGSLWPPPHDARFDFRASEHDARWIDELAGKARSLQHHRSEADIVVGHTDWRVQNIGFDADGQVCAVYDWDSLRTLPEPVLAGKQAANFTCDWSRAQARQYPTLEEALGFIADFEAARDAPFDARERRLARAGLVDALSYISRCEHSDQATGFGTHAAQPVAWGDSPADSARALLAAHGHDLLAREEPSS